MTRDKAFALALGLFCLSASAAELSHNEALELRRKGELLPFESILGLLSQRHPGFQIIEVELESEANNYIYDIEIFTSGGQIRELEIDARSGEVLDDEIDD
jgi:uncharacterized membrane protein YkoI